MFVFKEIFAFCCICQQHKHMLQKVPIPHASLQIFIKKKKKMTYLWQINAFSQKNKYTVY